MHLYYITVLSRYVSLQVQVQVFFLCLPIVSTKQRCVGDLVVAIAAFQTVDLGLILGLIITFWVAPEKLHTWQLVAANLLLTNFLM